MNQILPCPDYDVGWKAKDCVYLKNDFVYGYTILQLDPFSGEAKYEFVVAYLI